MRIPTQPDRDGRRDPGRELVPARSRPRLSVVREFQPDAIAIEERTPPRLARLTLYSVALLLLAGGTWASLTRIDEIAVAHGRLITTQPNLVVQPLETTVVRSIDVKVGETVKAGQTLATLDPTFTEADVRQIRTKFESADALTKRLDAEIAGTAFSPEHPTLPAEALEIRIHDQRALYVKNQIRNYDAEIGRAEATLARSRSEKAVLLHRLEGIRDIETMRETLFANQIGSKLNLLQARDTRLDIESSLIRLTGGMEETEHELDKTRAQKQAFSADFQRTTLEALSEARGRRDAAWQELKKGELRRRLVVLTSPADGIVLEIAQRSVGSVLREAEPFMTLVPSGVELEAEVLVDSKDIGQIAVGQEARVKFDAFPFQKHGTAHAVIRTISQDAFSSPGKDASSPQAPPALAFRARLALAETDLRAVPDGFRFIPGMSVQAEVRLGERSVISYLLYPIIRGLDEGLRER